MEGGSSNHTAIHPHCYGDESLRPLQLDLDTYEDSRVCSSAWKQFECTRNLLVRKQHARGSPLRSIDCASGNFRRLVPETHPLQ